MLSRASLVLLGFGVTLIGCDALSTPAAAGEPAQVRLVQTATGVALDAPAAATVAGDFHFRLDPVPPGTTVSARLHTTADDPRLEYAADGGSVRLVADGAEAVQVAYLADGREVAPRVDLDGTDAGVYDAGASDREPTSYHYVRQNDGSLVVVWDYAGESPTGAARTGTRVRLPLGETPRVTHIQFTAWGLDLGTVESVEILSPSALHLAEARVRR